MYGGRIAEIGPLTAVVGGGATRPHPTPHDTVVLRVERLAKVYCSGGSEQFLDLVAALVEDGGKGRFGRVHGAGG